ncbi:hypothetical protein [Timonella sp. A28]|uniref:hypothetical protein n=1 Tax=Timonella sp. A28 TaxID=3442640 RepID=UPI003EC0CF1E
MKIRDTIASLILAIEALYFIGATAYVTAFGISLARGGGLAGGFLKASSLPLVAVGAFALWALALTHVIPRSRETHTATKSQSGVSKTASLIGFYGVVIAHFTLSIVFLIQKETWFGFGLLLLGVLLFGCSFGQVKSLEKPRRPSKISVYT